MYNGFIITDTMLNDIPYAGKSDKFGITVGDKDYLIKFSAKRGKLMAPYTEYVASRFIYTMGLNAQEVWLGFYNDNLVSIIRDFTYMGDLRTFNSINQSSVDTSLGSKAYTYEDILDVLDKQVHMTRLEKDAIINRFWIMYVCDAILANRDRHGDNWGYLFTDNGYEPAPIYDNGSSLFPEVGKVIDEFNKAEFEFLCMRAEKFPASLLQIRKDDGTTMRTNYHEILGEIRNRPALVSVLNQFNFEKVYRSIYTVVSSIARFMPDIYKIFYIMIVCMRYLHSIERLSFKDAYDKIKRRMGYVYS